MTDTDIKALVERLRTLVIMDEVGSDNPLGRDAADALEALQSENAELRELVRSFVLDTIDYATRNKLGDAERQHNVKWARKLGITDTLEKQP